MDRRDFCGIIAAPLLRRFAPPVPAAAQPPIKIVDVTSHNVVAPWGYEHNPLTVSGVKEALAELARMQDAEANITIALTGELSFERPAYDPNHPTTRLLTGYLHHGPEARR